MDFIARTIVATILSAVACATAAYGLGVLHVPLPFSTRIIGSAMILTAINLGTAASDRGSS